MLPSAFSFFVKPLFTWGLRLKRPFIDSYLILLSAQIKRPFQQKAISVHCLKLWEACAGFGGLGGRFRVSEDECGSIVRKPTSLRLFCVSLSLLGLTVDLGQYRLIVKPDSCPDKQGLSNKSC